MIKIIKEVLNNYINNLIVESLTPIVYHFCDLSAFIGIASYNKFILTSSNTNQSDKRMAANGEYVYPYYMCFSRTKSPDVGYAYQRLLLTKSWQSCLVRLEIDGNKLNNLYKAHPVNYFINDNDDKIKKYDKGLNPNVDYKQIARQQMYEYEDRLLSTKPFINNANKYIKRVDILVKPRIFTDGRCAGLKSNIEYIINGNTSIETGKIYVYTDKIAFNHGDITKALPKEKFINPNGNQTSISLQLSEPALKPIASIINILCFSETQKPKKYLIQKYGFSDYTEKLLELCDSQNSVIHADNLSTQMSYISMCKPNFKKNGCWRYAVLMDEMVNDYLKAMNISFKEIPMYKKTQWRLLNNLPLNKKQKELEDVCRHNLQTNQFSTFLNMKNNNVEGLLKNN